MKVTIFEGEYFLSRELVSRFIGWKWAAELDSPTEDVVD